MNSVESIIQTIKEDPIENFGDIYHPIPFEEFRTLKPAVHENASYRKFDLIRSALPYEDVSEFSVLDIGANAGYFSYRFAQQGARSFAIEPHERYFNLGCFVADHYSLPIEWQNQPISIELVNSYQKEFDIALMLSVFQWISQGNQNLEKAQNILRTVSENARYLFFELGCNSGTSSINVDGSSLAWMVQLLSNHTRYEQIAYLGRVYSWGSIHKRWRQGRILFCCTNERVNLDRWQSLMTRYISRYK